MKGKIVTAILLSVLKTVQLKNICGFDRFDEKVGYISYRSHDPTEVENCQDCHEGLCKQADLLLASSKTDNLCYWNEYRDMCLPNKGPLISSEICLIILLPLLRPEGVLWLGQVGSRLRRLWEPGGVQGGVLLAGQTGVLCSHDRSRASFVLVISN